MRGVGMIKLNGKCVFEGIVLGRLSFYKRGERQIGRYCTQDPATEIDRFEAARAEAAEQLKELYGKALQRVGKANAMIFEIHIAMLNDPDYCAAVIDVINTQRVNAEYAVAASAEKFSEMLENIDDGYIKARAADVKDVSERMLNILSDTAAPAPSDGGPVIIAAEDLAPSETVQLDKEKVLAFVTMFGSINSHTAILARTMGIPAVIDVGKSLLLEYEGCEAAVDGSTGTVYINPDEKTQRMLLKKHAEELERHALLKRLSAEECITLDGKRINVVANVGGLDDVETALENGADGIGLFRSEFLYLENDDFPTEEEQFRVYKATAEKMSGRSVVIRTLDVGADKRADYFCLPEEKIPQWAAVPCAFVLCGRIFLKRSLGRYSALPRSAGWQLCSR